MQAHYDVAVIGAGIVGASTALHLQKRGLATVLIDRAGVGLGTSYGNSGLIETSYVLPFGLPPPKRYLRILCNRDTAVRFHYRALPGLLPWLLSFYRESQPQPLRVNGRLLWPLIAPALDEHKLLMAGTSATRLLFPTGRVKLYRSAESFLDGALERQVATELGAPFEVMEPEAFCALEPHVLPHFYRAVRWTSSARVSNPQALVAAYAERFTSDGGTFLKTSVQQLRPAQEQSWWMQTGAGRIGAKHAVICAGPWSADLYRPLGYTFPLGPKRGYHQHFAAVGAATLAHTLVDTDIGYLICPMEQGYRVTTGVEFAAIDDPATPVQIARALPFARQLFPLGAALETQAWHGSRPCFPDSLPVIGPAPRHANLWLNFGHGHSGLTIGPSSARLLAEMLTGAKPFCDPAPYSPGRFSRPHHG